MSTVASTSAIARPRASIPPAPSRSRRRCRRRGSAPPTSACRTRRSAAVSAAESEPRAHRPRTPRTCPAHRPGSADAAARCTGNATRTTFFCRDKGPGDSTQSQTDCAPTRASRRSGPGVRRRSTASARGSCRSGRNWTDDPSHETRSTGGRSQRPPCSSRLRFRDHVGGARTRRLPGANRCATYSPWPRWPLRWCGR